MRYIKPGYYDDFVCIASHLCRDRKGREVRRKKAGIFRVPEIGAA